MNTSKKELFLKKYRLNKDEINLLNEMEQNDYTLKRKKEIKQQQNEIEKILNSIPDERERILLQRKFYLGETYETISEKMNYSISHIKRLYKKAIENLNMWLYDIEWYF